MATALVAAVVSKSGAHHVGSNGAVATVAILTVVVGEICALKPVCALINSHPYTVSVHKGVDNCLKP